MRAVGLRGRIERFFCGVFTPHRRMGWVRNIYGDEIDACGGKRSLWRCSFCGAYEYRATAENEAPEVKPE
jgi:hypothetical protein